MIILLESKLYRQGSFSYVSQGKHCGLNIPACSDVRAQGMLRSHYKRKEDIVNMERWTKRGSYTLYSPSSQQIAGYTEKTHK